MVQFVGFSDVRFQIERFRGLGVFRVQDCRVSCFYGFRDFGLGGFSCHNGIPSR